MSKPGRIALFGGTFDPIHLGHLKIAQLAVQALGLDEVRFLPCRISPHKTDTPPTPGHHRLEMIRLAIRDLPWAVADDFDLKAPEPSYSHLTVAAVRRDHPDARIFWIMGHDQWEALPRWKEPQTLASELEFIVFSRDGNPRAREGWQLHSLEGTHPASASTIRESLRAGAPWTEWIPPAVLSYIRKHHLYTS
ncbi:nicotinate (nicotinamide) nucleotide adenylyltransferase [Haloferula chungangensis]|uniref:Probable nicotinate-nucleotide adenylyltransferase n=1 Tax=Haloferula chungangensis TaxID=1048331 RepID=A0ABW2L3B7_9BACT